MKKKSSYLLNSLRRVDLMCCQWWLIKKAKRNRREEDYARNLQVHTTHRIRNDMNVQMKRRRRPFWARSRAAGFLVCPGRRVRCQ